MTDRRIGKAWSIKDEGHLNKNNIIFSDKMKRLILDLERVNNNLGYYVLNEESQWRKIKTKNK